MSDAGEIDNHFNLFGYGSLVNVDTHDYITLTPARLTGWRRVWRRTSARKAAYLSIEPAPDHQIDGLVLSITHDHHDLAHRERAYNRLDVTDRLSHDLSEPLSVKTFAVPPSTDDDAGENTILLSYLDVVVSGYARHFGETGVAAFFTSTHGWGLPIHDDRSNPMYPRAHAGRDQELTDHMIAKHIKT